MRIGEIFAQLGSILAAFMFMKAILEQYFPHHLRSSVEKHSQKLLSFLSPYVQITFNEFTGERLIRSDAYSAIETYLSSNSSAQASRLKADVVKNSSQAVSLSMDDNEEVADEFSGVKVWWASGKNISKTQTFSFHPVNDEKRFYNLRFHKKHRKFITETYINHVLKEGKSIEVRNRQRKLYTNSGSSWSHVPFEHPATFQTLAMEPEKKRDIVDDLLAFSKAKDFYARIGRAWKRGYLLYGPPGTGKSTMIAAMANLLGYDLYDLELTAVKDNTELKKLLIGTSGKAIIVIEDIDCSADLTGQTGREERAGRG
ncbi:UNVERIFIED_CONTAM: AAA-ATPase ASD, mitochondrial [Sesamum latifolium]|uniref:AAA-ATPase ASD, mitochondrial n=1 Tax=Sesamum latifolium TaxID=2727402 RepID=A0AAW2VL56_9LAMI